MSENIQLTKQQYTQFHSCLTASNIARLKVCVWIVIFLECILLGRNFIRHGWTFHYYIQLYIALLVASLLVLLLIYQFSKVTDQAKKTRLHFRLLIFYYVFNLCWGVVITIIDQQSYGHVTAFLTNFMTSTLLFVVSPKQYAAIHTIPIIGLFAGIFAVQPNFNIATAHFINITVFIIFCVIGSRMIYKNYYKNFYQEIQLSLKNKELEQIAMTDSLTDVYNVRGMRQFVLKNEQLSHESITIMLLDIDFFKNYNDHYGHLAGNEVLKQVAMTIKEVISPHFLARVGGEEFMMIAHDLSSEQAEQLGEEICRSVERLEIKHEQSLVSTYVTISLGYVTTKLDATAPSFDELHDQADQALYEAKESGRNRIKVYKKT